MKRTILLLLVSLLYGAEVWSQCTVRGKITDENGETMVGVTVALKTDKKIATVSDLDGNFSLKIPTAGAQTLVFSFISYQPIEEKVSGKKGDVEVHDIQMEPLSKTVGEVVVTSKANKSNAMYMQTIKSKSIQSIDFVSSASIKRTGDASVAAAVARVTGVSTSSRGFITVRGIGDRYVKTAINGLRIPTLDPLTNNIKLDLFPSSLVDNIVLTKTASADLPGDWAGAYLSVETKDYPDKLTIAAESAYGYSVQTSFKENLSAQRSSTDWLGYDNGLREYDHGSFESVKLDPSLYDKYSALGLKDYYVSIGVNENTKWNETLDKMSLVQLGLLDKSLMDNRDAYKQAQQIYKTEYDARAIAMVNQSAEAAYRRFPNTWVPLSRKAPLNNSQSFSIGNQVMLFGRPFGFLVGARYASSTTSDLKAETNGIIDTSMLVVSHGNRQIASETNGWSALVNLAYKFNSNNSVSVLCMPNMLGMSRVRFTDKTSNPLGLGNGVNDTEFGYEQYYESRRQYVYQFKSEHLIPAWQLKIESNVSFTKGRSNTPDLKRLGIKYSESGYGVDIIGTPAFRVFSYLQDDVLDSRLSFELPLQKSSGLTRRIKFGGAYQSSYREMHQYEYVWNYLYRNISVSANSIADFMVQDGSHYLYFDYPYNHSFGRGSVVAGYGLFDYSILPWLRLSAGLRYEKAMMETDYFLFDSAHVAANDIRRFGHRFLANPSHFSEPSFLPSASLLCKLLNKNDNTVNMRLNYSSTVARPSLRELSSYEMYDFEYNSYIIGNPDLKMAKIRNYDLRFEGFLKSGDNLSVSLFYKDFTDHIEMSGLNGRISWTNSGSSWVEGIEIEGKKYLFKHFECAANVTLAKSQEKQVFVSIITLNRDTLEHEMFGQAPYVVNATLSYTADSIGLIATIGYNVQGQRLAIAPEDRQSASIYEMPRHLLDFKLTKSIGKHFSANLTIRDILRAPIIRSYLHDGKTVVYDRYSYGTLYQFALSYKF